MRRQMTGALTVTMAALCLGCGAAGDPTRSETGGETHARSTPDGDADGLCDVTEEDLGTDATAPDSDGDGISDLVEVAYDLDAIDPAIPASERAAILAGRRGATVDFAVRVTVTGAGDGLAGSFEDDAAIYDDDDTAGDYFRGAYAVSAEPQENVRGGIDRGSEKFSSVTGETRLGFSVRFEYPAQDAPSCVRAYPFGYTVTSSHGDVSNLARYLLVVVPPTATFEDGPWCGLEPCL